MQTLNGENQLFPAFKRVIIGSSIVADLLSGGVSVFAQSTLAQNALSSINVYTLPNQPGVIGLSGTNMHAIRSWTDEQLTDLVGALNEVPAIPASSLPRGGQGGTFWSLVQPGMPPLPGDTIGVDVWQMSDGSFLLDDLNFDYNAISAGPMRMGAMGSGLSGPPGFGDSGGGVYGEELTNSYPRYSINTNLLWLQITNIFDRTLYANLYNATNQVYGIWSTTNLALPFSLWQVETEVFSTNTNCMPFNFLTLGRPDLFLRAEDWTGVDSDGDGVPDWWDWLYFGVTTMDTSGEDYSGEGSTFAEDYSSTTPPTVFQFTGIVVTNNYVNSSLVAMQLTATGYPYYLAILVDNTNYADAVWNPYVASNLLVNLGTTEGWHDVWIGLRGHADAPSKAVWQWNRLKLDWSPPTLVITSPTSGVITQPWIQLQGYSSEPLSLLRYDISNAAGAVSNQVVAVDGQDYDTTRFEYTTTYFQAYGISLTNGLNVVTLHATDYAGNNATLTTNFTLDYSSKTNPPVVQLLWPLNGFEICGSDSGIQCQGWVDDDTATVTVQLVDANGQTSTVGALVGRDGVFYGNSLTLARGTNYLSYTVTDAAGNVATTNIIVSTSDLELTIDPVAVGQSLVTGTVGDTNYTIEVNGVDGTNNGDGTWAATIPPIGIGGGAVVVNAVQNEGDPSAQQIVQGPQGTFVSGYHLHSTTDVYNWNLDNWSPTPVQENWDWWYAAGGTFETLICINFEINAGDPELYAMSNYLSVPPCSWPQPMPHGTMVTEGWQVLPTPTPPAVEETNDVAVTAQTEHTDTTQQVFNALVRSKDDGNMSLATGGPVGSVQKNLWCLSATATDISTGLPIPASLMSIGAFGNQDTNDQLWLTLEDNRTVDVTVHVSGVQNYSYNVIANKYTLVHQTRYAALTDANPARLNLGVGEYVDLGGLPDAIWSASGGGLATNNGVTFTAASNAPPGGAAASVTVQSHGFTQTVNFTVFAPTNYDQATTFDLFTNTFGVQTWATAEMHVIVHFAPTSVSFNRLEVEEVGEDATNIWGCFTNPATYGNPKINVPMSVKLHHSSDTFIPVTWDNAWGAAYADDDRGSANAPVPAGTPWVPGGYSSIIPAMWRIGNGPTNSMTTWSQILSVDGNGTFKVEKFNLWVTRTLDDVVHTGQNK